MNRNFGVGFLIVCFGLSNINFGWADEGGMGTSPVMGQPYDAQELSQQIMDRDRQNRDEEIEIKELIENNDKLTQDTLAHQEDEGLEKIDQTMRNYRDALLARDRSRIMANGERWTSRYGDLVALTEDADNMTVHQDLELKSGLLSEKYQMLTALKDEMTALNEKLQDEHDDTLAQKETLIDGFKKIAQDQQDKIEMLIQKLGDTDQKIAQYDQIIAEKDKEIEQLKEELATAEDEVARLRASSTTSSDKDQLIKEKQAQVDFLTAELKNKINELNRPGPKDEIIKSQQNQIAMLKAQSQDLSSKEQQIKAQADHIAQALEQFKNNSAAYAPVKAQVTALKNLVHQQELDLKAKNNSIQQLNQALATAQHQPNQATSSQQTNQMPTNQIQEEVQGIKNDFAKNFKDYGQFESAIVYLKNKVGQLTQLLSKKQDIIQKQADQIAMLKTQSQDLSSKEQLIKAQTDEIARASEQFKNNGALYANVKTKINALKNLVHQQEIDLKAKNNAIQQLNQALTTAQHQPNQAPSQQTNQMPAQEIQEEVQNIKSDFAKKFKDYDQFVNTISSLKNQVSQLKLLVSQKQGQVDLLKSELENKITELSNQNKQGPKDEIIKNQQNQIAALKAQAQDLSSKEQLIKAQADEIAQASDRFKNSTAVYSGVKSQVAALKNLVHQQELDLKSKNDSIHWLNQVLAAAKSKANYYQVSAQQVQAEMQRIKSDFDQRFKDYDQFENAIASLKDKVGQLNQLLSKKQDQVDSLQSELKNKITELNNEAPKDEIIKNQESQIAALKAQSQDLSSKEQLIKAQSEEIAKASEQLKNNSDMYTSVKAQVDALKNLVDQQELDLKSKNDSIHWLNQVLATAKAKANYYQVSSQADQLSTKQVQDQLQGIKNDFAQQGLLLSKKQDEVASLQSELNDKIAELNKQQDRKDQVIKEQMANLKTQAQDLSSKDQLIKAQADEIAKAAEQFKDNDVMYAGVKGQVNTLKNLIRQQGIDLKSKNDSIHWLNQVLAAAKAKANYYQVSAQTDDLSMKQVQDEMQRIKNDFAQQSKDNEQFEDTISSLKDKMAQLNQLLSKKQGQVNLLKSELENKIVEAKNQGKKASEIQQDLQAQLQDRDNQIVKMKSDIGAMLQTQADNATHRAHIRAQVDDRIKIAQQTINSQLAKMKADIGAILQNQANEENYLSSSVNANVSAHAATLGNNTQVDDRIKLAQQLIDLQQQETALLDEKNNLEAAQNSLFDQYAADLESKIKGLLTKHHAQTIDLENRMQELNSELDQKEQQVRSLESQLKNEIAGEQNHGTLAAQIQDLKAQLQDKEDQITSLKARLQAGEHAQDEADSLKQQLASEQDKADQLQQQLDIKTDESSKMTTLTGDYQKKLESKDSAYNQQFGKIANLTAQLQQKEVEIVKIKKDMSELQELANAKDRDAQAKDLTVSMLQQRMTDKKIDEYQDKINGLKVTTVKQMQEVINLKTELALARQELEGKPSGDEIDFLRAGLKEATAELKQKDQMLAQIKANAAEYAKTFKEQSEEFQSLKDQLVDAQQQIQRKDEDLKYKDMALARLKMLSKGLNQRIETVEKSPVGANHEDQVRALQDRLNQANGQIKDLQEQVDQLKSPANSTVMELKLKQALDKISEQGRVINILVQKLQDSGHSVDLSKT